MLLGHQGKVGLVLAEGVAVLAAQVVVAQVGWAVLAE